MGCCDPKAPQVEKLLVGRSEIGLVGLDLCLAEIKSLELEDDSLIAGELVICVKKRNFIPDSAREEYAQALLAEYKKQFQLI